METEGNDNVPCGAINNMGQMGPNGAKCDPMGTMRSMGSMASMRAHVPQICIASVRRALNHSAPPGTRAVGGLRTYTIIEGKIQIRRPSFVLGDVYGQWGAMRGATGQFGNSGYGRGGMRT